MRRGAREAVCLVTAGTEFTQHVQSARAAGLPLAVRLLEPELELAGAGPVRLVEEAR